MASPLQTTFTNIIPSGFPGMIANGEIQNRITKTNEDATGIAFGSFVYRGVGDHGCTATPAAGKTLGVAVVDHGQVRRTASLGTDQFDQYDNVPIMQRGTVWVSASVAVNAGDQVYVTPAGAITNVSTSNVIATGWFFIDTISGAGVARISNNR